MTKKPAKTEEETLADYDPQNVAAAVEDVSSAKDFADSLIAQSETQSAYAQYFIENFMFYGKSLDDWSIDLQVEIPRQPRQHQLQDISVTLATNIQIVAHFKAVANSIYSGLLSGLKLQKDDLINALVRHYLRSNLDRPAVKVLDSMAESYMKDGAISRESAKLVKDFWTQKYDALIEVRKCLEQINLSIITEHKYSGGNEDPQY
jgi:hypothetical protein